MKVGIITINDKVNIGNRLQNYAVQELLKECGCEPTTLIYSSHDSKSDFKSRIKIFISNLLMKYGLLSSKFFIKRIKKDSKLLITAEFNKKYIYSSKKYFF